MADFNPPDERRSAAGRRSGRSPDPSRADSSGTAGDRPANGAAAARDPRAEPRPGAAVPRQAYAAIDLGTNNCRLLIARPADENFVVIDAFSRVVRLGEGLAPDRPAERRGDGPRARRAAGSAPTSCKRRNVHLARSVATEACRRASNGAEFIERVRRETGIRARHHHARRKKRGWRCSAATSCSSTAIGPAMIFDIGGGSTELVLIDSGAPVPRILDWQSVPWGVVSLTETVWSEQGHDARATTRGRALRPRCASWSPTASPSSPSASRAAAPAPRPAPARHQRHGDHARQPAPRPAAIRSPRGRRADRARPSRCARSPRGSRRCRPSERRAAAVHRQRARRPGGRRLRDPRGDPRHLAGRPARRRRPRHPRRHPAQPDGRRRRRLRGAGRAAPAKQASA